MTRCTMTLVARITNPTTRNMLSSAIVEFFGNEITEIVSYKSSAHNRGIIVSSITGIRTVASRINGAFVTN